MGRELLLFILFLFRFGIGDIDKENTFVWGLTLTLIYFILHPWEYMVSWLVSSVINLFCTRMLERVLNQTTLVITLLFLLLQLEWITNPYLKSWNFKEIINCSVHLTQFVYIKFVQLPSRILSWFLISVLKSSWGFCVSFFTSFEEHAYSWFSCSLFLVLISCISFPDIFPIISSNCMVSFICVHIST